MRIATLLLATSLWIISPTIASAQHHGGGHGGGHGGHAAHVAHGSGGHGGHAAFHGGGAQGGHAAFHGGGGHGGFHGGGYGHGGRGYGGLGYGGLGYGLFGFWPGGYWDGGYYSDDYPYYYSPSYATPPAYGYYGDDDYPWYAGDNIYQQQPLIPQQSVRTEPAAAPAYLEVVVPDPKAQVWIDGHLTTSTGQVRKYVTSSTLATGGTYSYDVRASWNENGHQMSADRHVNVIPGVTSRVDFTTGDNVASPGSS